MQGAGSTGRRQVRLPAGLPRQEPGGEWLLPGWPCSQGGAGGTAGGPGVICPVVAPPCLCPGPLCDALPAHASHPFCAGGFGVSLVLANAVGLLPLLVPRGCAFLLCDHSRADFPCLLGTAPHLVTGPGCPSGGCQPGGLGVVSNPVPHPALLMFSLPETVFSLVTGPEREPRTAIPPHHQHSAGQWPGKVSHSKSGRAGSCAMSGSQQGWAVSPYPGTWGGLWLCWCEEQLTPWDTAVPHPCLLCSSCARSVLMPRSQSRRTQPAMLPALSTA